jgi:hypothetical protein
MPFKVTPLLSKTLETLITEQSGKFGFAKAQWVYGKEANVYVRATRRALPQDQDMVMVPTIDLASIDVGEKYQQKGVFREVLNEVERLAALHDRFVFLESVLNEHLVEALPRYGYHLIPNSLPPAFYKSSAELQKIFNPSVEPKKSVSSRSSFK